MKNKFTVIAILLLVATSCVSPKVYKNLEDKYAALKKENRSLQDDYNDLLKAKTKADNELKFTKEDFDSTTADKNLLDTNYKALVKEHENLKASYDALESNSSSAIAANSKKNRELLAQLEAKEQALASENARLEQLKKELEARSNRVAELESVIAAKDAAMTNLKNAISNALTDFEGKGLTIEQRNGKVYVSMENKLLFNSGSWAVGTEGKNAVEQLASVLSQNPDINVLIEGHTDNVPYKGTTLIDNWDLSVKRATAIVRILKNKGVDPTQITAAGRSEFVPISDNTTAEGKAKNRRIEIILAPNLDEISKLLKE